MLDDGQVKEWQSLLVRAINVSLGKDGGPDDDGQTVVRLLAALEELALEKATLTVNITNQVLKAQAICNAESSRAELEVLQELHRREADAAQAEATLKQHQQRQEQINVRRIASLEVQRVQSEHHEQDVHTDTKVPAP
jgi:hypothetical protein